MAGKKEPEALYTAEEFAACAERIFGDRVTRECIEAALGQAGKRTATVAQAKQIVERFRKREVI